MTNTSSPRSARVEGLREDLVALRENEHWKDGRLFARQDKVEGKGHGLLRIKPGPQPLSAILACLNSDERAGCPYLPHRIPDKCRHVAAIP